MIDVESLWTSESAVENLHALIEEFYNVMCNDAVLPPEEIIKLDDRRDFAFTCKCGSMHVGHGRIWSVVATTINQNAPAEDHPEVEEYKLHRKEFMAEVEHIKIRDYAEPFLKETEEWKYVEAAISHHQKLISDFMTSLCTSKVTPEKEAAHNLIVAYYCNKHETNHYVSPQKNNEFRTRVSGGRVPDEFLPFLCKLSERIVLRDTSAAFRDWAEANPQEKIENVANRRRQEEKAARRIVDMAHREAVAIQAESRKAKNRAKAASAAKARLLVKKAKGEAKALLAKSEVPGPPQGPAVTFDDPNLYILKPNLMSEDWLIEYHVCGRKVAYKKVSEALIYKHTNFQEGYDVYECPYCSHWHYGRKGKPVAPAIQAKRGLRWYKMNHKKANIFIHRIMMEDFA
jgi:hypothetical protein